MRRHLIIGAALLALLSPAKAADSTVSAMTAASALGGTELLYCVQSAADRKCTPVQLSAYIFGLVSGDLTFNGSGVGTLRNTGPGATGPLGSATVAPIITIDAQGRVTALSSATITQPAAASPTATAGPTAVNGSAATFMRSDAAPAVQQGSAAQKGIVQVDGSTITASGGVISAATLTVATSTQTGSNYPFVTGDQAKVVYLNNASPQIPTIAQAGTAGFATGWFVQTCNIGAGTQTITPATSTIGGAATFVLPAASAARPACVSIISDGTNYLVFPDFPMDASMVSAGTVPAARGGAGTINGALKGNGSGVVSQAACADLSNGTALCSTTPGANVAAAAAVALSGAGGLTSTIASGTSALGTSAIASAACASAVTTSATNTATTDVVQWGFNGDPTAVTGYVPLVAGMLTIVAYPSVNNVNFKVCNNTSSSITPGAVTLNWRVAR